MNPTSNVNPVVNEAGQLGSFVPMRPRRRRAAKNCDPTTSSTSLESVQQELEQVGRSVEAESAVMSQFAKLTCNMTSAIWCGQFQQIGKQTLSCVAEFNAIKSQNLGLHKSSVLPAAESAILSSTSNVTTNGELTVIATPIFVSGTNDVATGRCICLALNLGGASAEPFLLTLQLVATYIARWYEHDLTRQLDWQIDATSAIAELMAEISDCGQPEQSAILATNRLREFLGAATVAIAFCHHPGSKRTRMASISGATEIDVAGEESRRIESTLNETLVRDSVTAIPDDSLDGRSMKLAHRQLIESDPGMHLVSAPLTTRSGKTIGAWLCLIPGLDDHRRNIQFAKVISQYLADALDVASRAAAGPVTRCKQQISAWVGGRTGKIVLASIAVIVLLLAIPVPHRIDCRCTLQPTVRRFAVAPHDGILLESFVKPGDIVAAGQIVARMDGRELSLELAELVAQLETATKKRDVNRSARDAAATKISEFEMEQLDAQLKLVRFRLQNLEIKTEIDGIVLQGDLEDARGAPVKRGDVLAEISPLEQLKLEVDVRESDVNYVKTGQSATVVLDGSPFNTLHGTIDSIHPMSEIRNESNVFVAEMNLHNTNRQLRPGMQGRAKVDEGFRLAGWILFHRPLERIYSTFR